jgi:2-polyprenyl-3-methyl-5-hydroxy-6-metoxy-1,4-benzoquinol methylase
MSDFITYKQCPLCNSFNIIQVLAVKDYTVSKETFPVWQCNDCTCRFTQKVPGTDEIGAYYQSSAYVSHSDTKKGIVNTLYHTVRNYTIQSKRRLVKKLTNGQNGSLLDVGAGTGAFAVAMQKAGWNTTALEPDITARENASRKYGLKVRPSDDLFSFSDRQFDIITLWHVLEHVHQLHEYTRAFQSILKDDGALIIAVPNYTSYDAAVYKEYWAAYDVPRHLYHFSPASVRQLMKQHSFKVMQYKPMWFDSFYVAMLSEQYKTGHNNLIRAAWNGWLSNMKALSNAHKCSSVIYIIKKAGSNV